MDPLAVLLVLLSAPVHAGWNLLARRERSEATFFGRMLKVVALAGFAPAVVSELAARSIPFEAWLRLVPSGVCGGCYFYLLARAYRSSDFTVVYPVARALPVLLVGLGDILRGRPIPPIGWAGITLVVFGCICAPLHSFREIEVRRFYNRAVAWMLLTAVATMGFTLLDKTAVERELPGAATAFRHCYFFYFFAFATFALLLRLFPVREQCAHGVGWKAPLLGAPMTYGGYALVVWAYQLSPQASYVVAFRQVSIIIGVVAAFAVYREKGVFVRLVGAVLITAGLLMIGLKGR